MAKNLKCRTRRVTRSSQLEANIMELASLAQNLGARHSRGNFIQPGEIGRLNRLRTLCLAQAEWEDAARADGRQTVYRQVLTRIGRAEIKPLLAA